MAPVQMEHYNQSTWANAVDSNKKAYCQRLHLKCKVAIALRPLDRTSPLIPKLPALNISAKWANTIMDYTQCSRSVHLCVAHRLANSEAVIAHIDPAYLLAEPAAPGATTTATTTT
jgi:hypothetical protein